MRVQSAGRGVRLVAGPSVQQVTEATGAESMTFLPAFKKRLSFGVQRRKL